VDLAAFMAREPSGEAARLDPGVVAADSAGADVNAIGGTQNCVNCAVAGDSTLGGAPASALDSAGPQPISILEKRYGSSFKPVAGQADIENIMSSAGSGARGIVFGSRGANAGHVFNVVNQGGTVRFIDFQAGTGASFDGYQGFYLLRTN
jgi:filamentous hemagglutinin